MNSEIIMVISSIEVYGGCGCSWEWGLWVGCELGTQKVWFGWILRNFCVLWMKLKVLCLCVLDVAPGGLR